MGAVVKQARERRGIPLETLAEELNIGSRHLASIEAGTGKPSYAVLVRMIRILNIQPDLIFYPDEAGTSEEAANRESLIRAVKTCREETVHILLAVHHAVEEEFNKKNDGGR